MSSNHAYPQQLAAFIDEHWHEGDESPGSVAVNGSDLPVLPLLESLISTAFQTSLLREEERPLTFRLVLADPSLFPPGGGPPNGVHTLVFAESLPFTPAEVKSLACAASFHRSLIGLRLDNEGAPQIWGIVHTGPRWLHTQHGGRGSAPALPQSLVINVTGPGCIEICKGSIPVGQMTQGRVFGPSSNILQASWLQDMFAQTRAERMALHLEARGKANKSWSDLDPEVTHIIDQHMVKRMLAAIRAFKHGGTLIMVSPDYTAELLSPQNKFMNIKYRFSDGEPRARFRTLIVTIMNALAEGTANGGTKPHVVSWKEYQESTDPAVYSLDESIFEMSHLIAALSTVDGAVVMTRRFELLGFGAEIRCDLADVKVIAKALDLDGNRCKLEPTRGVGTRHRAAYDLCHTLKDVLAIVISQDGGIRFVRWHKDNVTCWDHQATFAFADRF